MIFFKSWLLQKVISEWKGIWGTSSHRALSLSKEESETWKEVSRSRPGRETQGSILHISICIPPPTCACWEQPLSFHGLLFVVYGTFFKQTIQFEAKITQILQSSSAFPKTKSSWNDIERQGKASYIVAASSSNASWFLWIPVWAAAASLPLPPLFLPHFGE